MPDTPDMKFQDLHLRQASQDDAPLLVSILHAAFEEYREQLDPPSGVHHESVETVRQKLHKGHAIIAYLDTEAIGCVFYQPDDAYLYFGRLSVLPQYRQRGVARLLIEYVEQQAVLLHLPRVQLGVRTALPHLQAYYARRGYRPVSYEIHEGYTEPTYVLMEKDVAQSG